MPMFKKNLKLIATAIGLVTVLVMGLAMPGATQQNPLSRANVVQAVNNIVTTLTATEGELLNPDAATFVSDIFATYTYIPIAKESRSAQRLLEEVCSGKDFAPILLGVVVADHYPTPELPQGRLQGSFYVYLTSKGVLQFVTQDGDVAFEMQGRITCPNVDLSKLPWHLKFDLELRPPIPTALLEQSGSCLSNNKIANKPTVDCTKHRLCDSLKFLGFTIWERCVDVIVCDGIIYRP
jgi:hypothetical protein